MWIEEDDGSGGGSSEGEGSGADFLDDDVVEVGDDEGDDELPKPRALRRAARPGDGLRGGWWCIEGKVAETEEAERAFAVVVVVLAVDC